MKVINIIKAIAPGIFMSVLAGDLLYLYYAGGWYDPIPLIEKAEVVLLYILVIAGIAIPIQYIREAK